jgi:reductive dehalogenase
VFLVEMDFDQMQRAPRAEAIGESARQYYRAAVVARNIEAALVASGYSAGAHYDAHYEVILPPLAVAAGLGELGRHNLLIADHHGTRVRIGAVTTDAPLRHGAPTSRGVRRFCEACLKCADNCPARALSGGRPADVRGITKWPTHSERCYGYWRSVGTDCGICMAVCPFSHRSTWVHNFVRGLVRRAPWLAAVLVRADDLVYGREWRGRFRGE